MFKRPKMAQFFKFKYLNALKLIFNGGGQNYLKNQFFFSKSEKYQNKIVKFDVENFEHLHCRV